MLRRNYVCNNSYNYKVVRREENLILYEKMNVERRLKVEDVNYDKKMMRFSIELVRRIYKTVGGEIITQRW